MRNNVEQDRQGVYRTAVKMTPNPKFKKHPAPKKKKRIAAVPAVTLTVAYLQDPQAVCSAAFGVTYSGPGAGVVILMKMIGGTLAARTYVL